MKKKTQHDGEGGSMSKWFRTLDLKSGETWFNASTRYCYLDFFLVVLSSNPRPHCEIANQF